MRRLERRRPGSGECVPGRAHIRHFGTAARFAGRGVGRMLFDRCEADAAAAGFEWFECQSSLNGEGFYAALGFRRLGPVDVPLSGGLLFPSILMERPILP